MKYKPSAEGQEIVKPDYRKKIIFSLDDFDEKGHLLQVVTIPPETRQRPHSHEKQTEVFYILEGEATLTINDVDITGPDQYAKVVSGLDKSRAAALLVMRGEQTQWVTVTPGK